MLKIAEGAIVADNLVNSVMFAFESSFIYDTIYGYIFKNSNNEYFIMTKNEACAWIFSVTNTPHASGKKSWKYG